jgi:hypothetical protein
MPSQNNHLALLGMKVKFHNVYVGEMLMWSLQDHDFRPLSEYIHAWLRIRISESFDARIGEDREDFEASN